MVVKTTLRAGTTLTVIAAAVLFAGSTLLFAHDSGLSFEAQDGNILIDVGYSVEEFTDDTTAVFDFEIKDNNGARVPFTDVWVRITNEDSTVFATGVHNARLGGALMTYAFPSVGTYDFSVRFQNGVESIAQATFPIEVISGSRAQKESELAMYGLYGVVGFVVGVVAVLLYRRRGSKVNTNL